MKKILVAAMLFCLVISTLVFALPEQAADIAKEKSDKGPLTKITFIHYKNGFVKPVTECGNGICEPGENINKCPVDCGGDVEPTSSCYGFLAKEAKWKTTENYLVNTTNSNGLSDLLILGAALAGVNEWENYGGNIFGDQIQDNTAVYVDDYPDEKNTVTFGDIPIEGVIGIANVWGYFRGPPQSRELVEWDIKLDDTDFEWGDTEINSSVMDVQNILTHELGHSAGMGDIYDSQCSMETMYGYSTEGEITKRDLFNGDITGIRVLYQ